MIKQRKNIIAIFDIGTSKISSILARIEEEEIYVIAYNCSLSGGIKSGVITDIQMVEASLINAIENLEKASGINIKNTFISITSSNLVSKKTSCDLITNGHEITERELEKLKLQIYQKFGDENVEMIHTFALDYCVDGNRGIKNPIGMFCNKIVADFHLIFLPVNLAINFSNCLSKCHLEVERYIASGYASGLACLTSDEKEIGATLIEFGAGSTCVSIFHEGNLIFTDGVPFGGISITTDIAKGLSIDFALAEKIKIIYGSVIMTSDIESMIEIDSEEKDEEILSIETEFLIEIIRARIEEILSMVMKKLEDSGVWDLGAAKIIIAGGVAQTPGMKELISHIFKTKVRLADISNLKSINSFYPENPSNFLCAVGMLLAVASYGESIKNSHSEKKTGLKNFWNWIKENF